MDCPHCSNAFAEADVCTTCRQGLRFAGRTYLCVPSELSCMRCPDAPLFQLQAGPGLTIDLCLGCHGIWLDDGELGTLLAGPRAKPLHGQAAPAIRSGDFLPCPCCHTWMDELRVALDEEVRLHRCRGHGVWVGAAELAALRAAGPGARDALRVARLRKAPEGVAPPGTIVSAPGPVTGSPARALLDTPLDRLVEGRSTIDGAAAIDCLAGLLELLAD